MTLSRRIVNAVALGLPVLALTAALFASTPSSADDRHHRWHHRDWNRGEWRSRYPDVYVAPGYVYAPPPVVYSPPPVYPGFGIGLNFNFD